jgi:hypothetical protein
MTTIFICYYKFEMSVSLFFVLLHGHCGCESSSAFLGNVSESVLHTTTSTYVTLLCNVVLTRLRSS